MHLPPEQSSSQLLDDVHVSLHAPPEQSSVQPAFDEQVPSQPPPEQSVQAPDVQSTGLSDPGGRGSGKLGELELHAATAAKTRGVSQARIRKQYDRKSVPRWKNTP